MADPVVVLSPANPLLAALRRLARDPGATRRLDRVWLEGDHLCRAWLERHPGRRAPQAVVAASAWAEPARRVALAPLVARAERVALVADALLADASGLASPAPVGFVVARPAPPALRPDAPTVVLDRLQDAGNVGSVLRSAAAFGIAQAIALPGTAAPWSPKVLRAAMGAHFALSVIDGADAAAALDALRVPLVGTALGAPAIALPEAPLAWPCAWVFGHEGQGVDARLLARCALRVTIPQPGGEESLNVAAAAAVCLYESSRRRRPGAPDGRAGSQ